MAAFERLADAGEASSLASWPRESLGDLAVVCGSSPALVRYLVACGKSWPQAAAVYTESNPSVEALMHSARPPAGAGAEELGRRLRKLAAAEMYRIGVRDLLGLASLTETVRALSRLAELTLSVAVDHLRELLAREGGDVIGTGGKAVGFTVLGMGKLGGSELNYSSDIDLIYMYETDAVADGSPPAREFFTRLASAVTKAIGETTAEGQVFRVDLRLRPEGNNGPTVNSIDNILGYYEGWGDTWERGALAKCRPVAGDLELGNRFIEEIKPFIYRRHLDYQTVEDLRSMKGKIDAELALQKPGTRNVKIGRGGIRELEFVVQVLQLIYGGHCPALQVPGTIAGLEALEREGYLKSEDAALLKTCYGFLRDVEHAVQIEEKRQTQTLPSTQQGLELLARRLGFGRGTRGRPASDDALGDFEAEWKSCTEAVHESFIRFLEMRPGDYAPGAPESDSTVLALLAFLGSGELDAAADILQGMGFPEPDRAAEIMARIYHGRFRGPASPQRRRAVEALAPSLLKAVPTSSDPMRALEGLVDFLIRSGAHTSYLALLSGSPKTMEILVQLFASSPYLASLLVGRPELLDSLVRSDATNFEISTEAYARVLEAQLPADRHDEEAVMTAMRRFRTAELVRIGLNDLSGACDIAEVHRCLSRLADACLLAAVEAARTICIERFPGPWQDLRLAVIAMGKMGACEMSYGSDLDLIFVYASPKQGYDGDAHLLATRWVQRIISLLGSRTRDGIVYEVDARLRPSGRSGPLVTSLERFSSYHGNEAELWERQALIRARVVYGDGGIRTAIEENIEHCVYSTGLGVEGVAEIAALRARVENELAGESEGRLNLKTGKGGIVDVEFLVQMLQLRHGASEPALRKRSTAAAIESLREAGIMDPSEASVLLENYYFLRRLESRLRLEWDRPVEGVETAPEKLAPLASRMGFRGRDAGAELLAEYRCRREQIRRIYNAYFEAGR